MIVVNVLLTVFFSSSSWDGWVLSALYMVGLWKLFEKSGLKGWWALVPVARNYQLSRGAKMRAPSTR